MTPRSLTVRDREAVIGRFMGDLGKGEHPPGSNCTEAGHWYGIGCVPWCAEEVSYIFHSVLGFSPFPATSSKGFAACVSGAQWFRRNGRWADAKSYPRRGSLIFFRWPGDTIEHHVGLVLGGTVGNVSTIEGNSGDRVRLANRRASIAGYGIIPYSDVNNSPINTNPPPMFRRTLTPSTRNITMGERDIIERTQNLLKWVSAKYHNSAFDPGDPNGIFNPKTAMALIAWKRSINSLSLYSGKTPPFVPPNAALGPKTYGLLRWWAEV